MLSVSLNKIFPSFHSTYYLTITFWMKKTLNIYMCCEGLHWMVSNSHLCHHLVGHHTSIHTTIYWKMWVIKEHMCVCACACACVCMHMCVCVCVCICTHTYSLWSFRHRQPYIYSIWSFTRNKLTSFWICSRESVNVFWKTKMKLRSIYKKNP